MYGRHKVSRFDDKCVSGHCSSFSPFPSFSSENHSLFENNPPPPSPQKTNPKCCKKVGPNLLVTYSYFEKTFRLFHFIILPLLRFPLFHLAFPLPSRRTGLAGPCGDIFQGRSAPSFLHRTVLDLFQQHIRLTLSLSLFYDYYILIQPLPFFIFFSLCLFSFFLQEANRDAEKEIYQSRLRLFCHFMHSESASCFHFGVHPTMTLILYSCY